MIGQLGTKVLPEKLELGQSSNQAMSLHTRSGSERNQ